MYTEDDVTQLLHLGIPDKTARFALQVLLSHRHIGSQKEQRSDDSPLPFSFFHSNLEETSIGRLSL